MIPQFHLFLYLQYVSIAFAMIFCQKSFQYFWLIEDLKTLIVNDAI